MLTLVHIITHNCKIACNQIETTLNYCQHINLQMTHWTLSGWVGSTQATKMSTQTETILSITISINYSIIR